MKFKALIVATTVLMAAPVFADGHATGDAEAGESVFKKCRSCHMIVSDDDTVIQKGGRTGPNLYGVFDRTLGSKDGFKYSKGLAAAGGKDLAWDEGLFSEWVGDPNGFLKANVGDDAGRSKMTKQRVKPEDLTNLWAYLVSVGPAS